MEDTQKKKRSDFICWLALVVLIVWAIMQHPMIIFGVIAFIGLWYYFRNSQRKSADIEEKEPDFTVADEKTDSFYSGISGGSSISISHSNERKSTSEGSSINEDRGGISQGLHP